MKHEATILAITAALALTACNPTVAPVVTRNLGDVPADLDVTYNPAADEVTVRTAGVTTVLPRDPSLDYSDLEAYSDGSTMLVIQANTPSGAGFAGAGFGAGAVNFAGSQYGRVVEMDVPTSGSATYTGSYGAVFTEGHSFVGLVRGDLAMSADFDDLMISGSIENRTINVGGALDDVVLVETSISSQAEFSGSATGGAYLPEAGSTTSAGSYKGLIVGEGGGEVVGGLKIDHLIDGNAYIESGAFVGAE